MRRYPRLPRLRAVIASVAAAIAAIHATCIHAQTAALPVPPPVTAAATMSAAPMPAAPKDPLLEQLDTAIEISSRRHLTANAHSPWQIFHGLLALKQELQLNLGNSKVNAIEFIATSEPRFDNKPLLAKTPHGGKFHPFTRPYAFEGHPAQFLALLSQSDLPLGYRFKVDNSYITLNDIINNTMKEVNSAEEVTWVLWALQHYLKPDAQWMNQHLEQWSIERLVQIETAAPVVGAPCGGNHRLFALTRTRDKHLKHGGKLVGVWLQADHKIRQHIELARALQNSDGTFSSEFYKAPAVTNDLNKRFNTSGHTMEFLSIALPDGRLNEPWVRNAISVLCRDLLVNRQRQIDCGPLYHTLNSLIIYRDRVLAKLSPTEFGPPAAAISGQLAVKNSAVSAVPALSSSPSAPIAPQHPASSPSIATASPKDKGIPVLATSQSANLTTPRLPVGTVNDPIDPTIAGPSGGGNTIPIPSAIGSTNAAGNLNELKLSDEARERLETLTSPRSLPQIAPRHPSRIPIGIPNPPGLLAAEPPSALAPVNR